MKEDDVPELSDGGAFIRPMPDTWGDEPTVQLDGYFTAEDLLKLVEWMKPHGKDK